MPTESTFPNASSLCERCGYPLRGLAPEGACPECGLLIAGSHPGRRNGPAWERGMDARSAWQTLVSVVRTPKSTFRGMRVDGSNMPCRLFLLMTATAAGLVWHIGERLALGTPAVLAWLYGMLAFWAAVAMVYIEVLGVTYFSGRRGWRVPLTLAERVACYASVWLPLAAAVMLKVRLVVATGWLRDLWAGWVYEPVADAMLLCIALGVSTLAFEWLVWLGVRQVRFANRAQEENGSP